MVAPNEMQFLTVSLADGRQIAYAKTKGVSTPTLAFYPLGASRRFLKSLPAGRHYICVNRPGTGGTSKARDHLATHLSDICAVLDACGVSKVSVLTECAGTTFALAFCARHPERWNRHILIAAGWVQPADCPVTTWGYSVGTKVPSCLSGCFGSCIGSFESAIDRLMPESWATRMIRGKLSPEEQIAFDNATVLEDFGWIRQESGSHYVDVAVLMDQGVIDYDALQDAHVEMWHGTNDTVIPYKSAQWLATRLGANLHTMEGASHEGLLFWLHPEVSEALAQLA